MHRHEWFFPEWEIWARCRHCDEILGEDEVERRLNATECLTAEMARWIADLTGPRSSTALLAYASALEGGQDVKAE